MKLEDTFGIEIPSDDIEHLIGIGSYSIIMTKKGKVFIQGFSLFDITQSSIHPVSIIPLDNNDQNLIENFRFEKEDTIIYRVSYDNRAWYFKRKETAFELITLFLGVKEFALLKNRNTIKFE